MKTINEPGHIQTVVATFEELADLGEKIFCDALYDLTEQTSLPVDVYETALQEVNEHKEYNISKEDGGIGKVRSWIAKGVSCLPG